MVDHAEVALLDTKIGYNYELGVSIYIRLGIVGMEMEQRHVDSKADGPRQYIDTPLPRDFAIKLRNALTEALRRTAPDGDGRDRVAGGAA
jgi:hypothetical protein